jgi:hypothetical protein
MDGTWAPQFVTASTYWSGLPVDAFQKIDNGNGCFESIKVYRSQTLVAFTRSGSRRLHVKVRVFFLCGLFHTQSCREKALRSSGIRFSRRHWVLAHRIREEEPVLREKATLAFTAAMAEGTLGSNRQS